nr:MAG TPA: hypothetical protein [Caudoviricetes sp.]
MEEKKITNPVKAIRAKCLDCCCGSSNEVELCTCNGREENHEPSQGHSCQVLRLLLWQ